MRLTALLVVLTVSTGCVLAAGDLDAVQGTWKRVSGEVNGKALPEAEVQKTSLTIQGDKYTLKIGEQTRTGILKLDASKTPHQIDIISDAGPNKGKSLLGIYELDGDTFKYCLGAPGKERPTEFASKPGSGAGLYVNKRQKP
jgi:uncharacterized protein (TIGR03067 family)